jgi:hypothetical protein
MEPTIDIWDLILTPFYLFVIYLIAYRIKATYIIKYPEYKYFVKGLTFKIIGAILFALVYEYYYGGGDTTTYFRDSRVLSKMLFYKPLVGLSILAGNISVENYSAFDVNTYWPHLYMWRDPNSFTVIRYTTFFTILGSRSYIVTSILVGCFSYIGVWKLFKLFKHYYSEHVKVIAFSILFLPSFVFWGSGIMKDTFIVGASCWMTYNFFKIFISPNKIPINVFLLLMNFIIMLNIKPYIIACIVPSMLIWINQAYIRSIKSKVVKIFLLPLIVVIISVGGYFIMINVSGSMGEYGNVDSAIEKAKLTQEDLLREDQYGGNNYDLGEIDGSFKGLLKIAPLAIYTAMYRPFLTETNNIMMFFTAFENFILLLITVYILLKVPIKRIIFILSHNPLMQFSLVFTIVLAFGVGLASANFGALVRYKIPFIPFYYSTLFLIFKLAGLDKNILRRL